ncbi:MAG: hypothetical protein Q7J70_05875 [Thermodesulfovibrionales bacterium]|nr:hypothetical protein [Thermodesulfovibrionales bacterium]
MEVDELLKSAMAQNASDVHIKVGSPPIMRVNGELAPMASANKVYGKIRSRLHSLL